MKNYSSLLRPFCATLLLLIFTILVQGQCPKVNGIIKDEDGAALQGADIIVKGSAKGVTSGPDGRFRINISGNSAILVISHVGFVTQEVPAAAGSTPEVTLKRNVSALNDVVVI